MNQGQWCIYRFAPGHAIQSRSASNTSRPLSPDGGMGRLHLPAQDRPLAEAIPVLRWEDRQEWA